MNVSRPVTFEFVDLVPAQREEGKLYISIKYRTAVHDCFCGCGMKVVTPIRPTGWKLTYDGDVVTLHPSIGNWSFPCRSHYWINDSVAIPAGPMDDQDVAAGRSNDQRAKEIYFGEQDRPRVVERPPPIKKRSLWQRIFRRS
jgi:hypothetical protein